MPSRLTLFASYLLLAFALPADAQSQATQSPDTPGTGSVRPGTFRLNVRPPEPAKWNVQRDGKTARTIYTCKPLACPDALRISIAVQRSPTRNPDPQALEKLATVDLPKAARAASAAREIISDGAERIETVASETASYHGYPAVRNMTRYSRASSTVYKGTTLIFARPAMVKIEATSPLEALVKQTTEAFISGMKFEEGPSAPKKPAGNTI